VREGIVALDKRGDRVKRVLERARAALLLAEKVSDAAAGAIARRAIAKAERMLQRLAAALVRHRTRRQALEKARGQDVRAVVSEARGDVSRQTPNGWQAIGTSPLGPGDVVRTGAASQVELLFEDGSAVTLGPGGEFKIAEVAAAKSS
jgi:hypothetical protein